MVRSILNTFIEDATRPPYDLRRLKANIFKALDDPDFSLEAQSAKNRWLEVDYREIVELLKAFLGKCAPEERESLCPNQAVSPHFSDWANMFPSWRQPLGPYVSTAHARCVETICALSFKGLSEE